MRVKAVLTFEVFDDNLLNVPGLPGSGVGGHLDHRSVRVAEGGKVGPLPVVLGQIHGRRRRQLVLFQAARSCTWF